MKMRILITAGTALCLLTLFSPVCGEELRIRTRQNESGIALTLHVRQGEHWGHRFKAGLISINTTPQIAVWVEDLDGNYIDTLYVTMRTATQNWRGKAGPHEARGNIRRKASLPYWAHKRGIMYEDGLYLPTKKEPLPDSITSASPNASFRLESRVPDPGLDPEYGSPFVVLLEVNNSTDFNEFYTEKSKPGDPNFSGGSYGSGQPALVYTAAVDTSSGRSRFGMSIIGHSSPSGDDGRLYEDVSTITTAGSIIDTVYVEME
jgi:hypothetical protein